MEEPLTGNWPPCTLPWIAEPVINVVPVLVEDIFEQPEVKTTAAVTAAAKTVRRLAFDAIQGVNIIFALSADIESDSPKGSICSNLSHDPFLSWYDL
jgi:hypothetical protein